MQYLNTFLKGIEDLLFPRVCQVCGNPVADNEHSICSICLMHKFEKADADEIRNVEGVFLPECLSIHHALWEFDKGGYLQDILHSLKYHGNRGAGVDMGRALGRSLLEKELFGYTAGECILIPVPLHPAKERKRGYNQSRAIAEGVSEITDIELVSKGVLSRVRNTKTQTGFSLNKRRENMKGVFSVTDAQKVENKVCILIDDVYTTGATLFEMAFEMQHSQPAAILSATVAYA